MNELRRPQQKKIIAGVCAGVADRFGVAPWKVRALFVLSTILPGPQFLLYIALWLIVPAA